MPAVLPPRARALVAVPCALATLAAASLTACADGPAAASAAGRASRAATTSGPASAVPPGSTVQATLGALRISGGYVPAPASPDVAAGYLTVTDTAAGGGDAVVAASSDAGPVTLHRTEGGAMVPLSRLDVPGGGSAAFSPGAAHLMIEPLTRRLVEGDVVALTLTFATAGPVTVFLPVTGYATGGDMPGMS